MKYLIQIAILIVGLFLGWNFWSNRPVTTPPGILVSSPPVQGESMDEVIQGEDDWQLNIRASFSMECRVLSKKRYWYGRQAKLAPLDVAVGWGAMSDQSVLDALKISQSNRFYFYKWKNPPPLDPSEIQKSSTNLHLIAPDSQAREVIRKVRRGQILVIDGYLVDAHHPDGISWPTSLSRTDSGNGACEIVLVSSCSIRE